jgi:membrane-bound serine protease (ClpP class)
VGEVREAVGPGGGHVLVHGELWSARSPVTIPEGARVRVVGVRGLEVEVMPLDQQLKEAT